MEAAPLTQTEKKTTPKLLISSDNFLPRWDGVSRFLNELIPNLKDDFDITVLAPNFPGKYSTPKGVKVVRFDIMQHNFGDIQFSKPDYTKAKKYVEKTDIIFAQNVGPIGMCAITAASRLKKPIVYYVHSIDWELTSKSVKRFKKLTEVVTKLLVKHFYNKVKTLLVPSKEVRKIITHDLRIDKNIEVVRLGIDTTKFRPPENKSEAKKLIGLDPNHTIIGFYGRISREKSILTLLDAYKKLKPKYPNCRLLVVGDGVSELINKLKDEDGVILTGAVNNGERYLQAMDIYVLPSLTETTSLTTLEAMSCGLPVLSTKVGFIKEYIKEKHNGLFFPKENPLVLSLKIKRLLDNPQEGLTLGEHARGTVLREFRWDQTSDKIKKILKEYAPIP